MIVYLIRNLINGKGYVGQTVRSFDKRYSNGRWWKSSCNSHLKSAAKKYGKDNFEIKILESNITDPTYLDDREKYYIKHFNTVYPCGYNLQEGGQYAKIRPHHPTIGSKIAKTKNKGRIYKLLNNKTGIVEKFTNISSFCRLQNLNIPHIYQVLVGQRNRYRTWSLPDKQLKKIILIDPKGRRHVIPSGQLKPFCRSNNLDARTIFRLIKGQRKTYKEWVYPTQTL